MAEPSESLWTKVDFDRSRADASPREPKAKDSPPARPSWRNARPALDVVSTLVWTYGLLKVFIIDVDREILGWIAEFRFFAFLALAAALVVVFRKPWRIVAAVAYIALFPLVVVCWKVPAALYRSKSWVATFAVLNVVSVVVADIRYTVLFITAAAFATLGVVAARADAIIASGAGVVALLLVLSVGRAVRKAVSPSQFLALHQRAIRRTVASPITRHMTSPDEDLRHTELEKFTPQQQNLFVQSLSQGVIVHRALYFWAHKIDQYRQSPASLFFSVLSVLWLLIQTAVAFTLINDALFKIDPESFSYVSPPSFAVLLRYSVSSMYAGEIDALKALSDLANVVAIAATVVGAVVVLSLFVSVILSFQQTRDDRTMRSIIEELKREGTQINKRLKADWEVSADEAIDRLNQLGAGLLGVITFLSSRIPPGFDDEDQRTSVAGRGEDA